MSRKFMDMIGGVNRMNSSLLFEPYLYNLKAEPEFTLDSSHKEI